MAQLGASQPESTVGQSRSRRVAVVTGASSGIGAATGRLLAAAGFEVVWAARRRERLEELAAQHGGRVVELDVTDPASVAALATAVPDAAVVVHSAGGALGLDPVSEADEEHWRWMYDANVLGVVRVTKALLPALLASGDGHVVVLGSIAGRQTYPGGGGYTAAKHAVRAYCRTLREELMGQPVRVTEVAPGLVETEFSLVRFAGDAERAAGVYTGVRPLTADDVAEVVVFAVTRPPHVDLDVVELTPRAQVSATRVFREKPRPD